MDTPAEERATESGWPVWVERFVMPYMQETALWPVLLALLGHTVVIIAPILTNVARGWLPAFVPLFVVVNLSGWLIYADVRRKWRPGAVTATVAITWVLATIVAVAAYKTNIF